MLKVFISGILWGTIGIFVNELNSLGAGSSLIPFLRMSFAFVIMSAVSFLKFGKKILIRDKKSIFFCVLLGFICNGLFNIFYTASIKLNGVGIACILMYTAPVFTALASRLLFHEKFSGLKAAALVINILGCILTVTKTESSIGFGGLTGILAGVGTGFCYGMAPIFGKFAGEKTDSMIVSMYSYFFAVIFLMIFSMPDFKPVIENSKILYVGFLYGLIPTALTYVIYYDAVKKIKDTSKVPVIASIEPVTAVLVGIVLYNEEISLINLMGFIIVLFSIAIMIKEKEK